MKKTLLICIALLVAFGGYAQKEKKPNITKANALREKGDLAAAKEMIDQATTYEKTMNDGKTWYYRGLIYATLDTTSNAEFKALAPNALEEAMASFKKSDELGDPSKEYYTTGMGGFPVLKSQQIDGYYGYYFNKAVNAFTAEAFQDAVDNFLLSAKIVSDTNSFKNAAYAAHNGQLYDQAKTNYRLAIDKGARSKDLYFNYLNILTSVEPKDNATALKLVDEALTVFNNEPTLTKTRINLLIQDGKIEEAKGDLNKSIELEPENPNLWFTLAAMYEELKDPAKAMESYNKALEIDPNHYESNFNKGVMLIDEANVVIKESNNLGVSKADLKKAAQLEPIIQEKLKAALPQWEKIQSVKPDDVAALETLRYIYRQLKMYDKAEEVQTKLDALPAKKE